MPGKERSAFKQHHPWLFAGSVGRLEGRARPGDTVEVLADNLRRWAAPPTARSRRFAPASGPSIRRIIDDAFFKRRIAAAVARRQALPELRGQQGLRLIHAESDGLPGVIADQLWRHGGAAADSAGADKWRNAIVAGLVKATGCARIYERSDSDVRGLEGLEPTTGWIYGEAAGRPAEHRRERRALAVDIVGGHKTGFYLDQRDNRACWPAIGARQGRAQLLLLHRRLFAAGAGRRRGERAVDRFVRPGAGPGAGQPGAQSAIADAERAEWLEADVFQALRDFRKEGRFST
jgi:23S rRNA (cytosine1962-C5)-methyltransferase